MVISLYYITNYIIVPLHHHHHLHHYQLLQHHHQNFRHLQQFDQLQQWHFLLVRESVWVIDQIHRRDVSDLQNLLSGSQQAPLVIFTIGFGSDADEIILRQIAEVGTGQYRPANETDIEELYRIISTYF